MLERSFMTYPQTFCLPNFSVFYLTRIGKIWGACTFEWALSRGWSDTKIHTIITTAQQRTECGNSDEARARSVIFVSDGSGGTRFRNFYSNSKWSKHLPLLSRSIFGAFCDFIASTDEQSDPLTGGIPQLSCIYPKGSAQKIGFVEGLRRYLYGIELDAEDIDDTVRWVNNTFENCEPRSGLLRCGAQRQPAPS